MVEALIFDVDGTLAETEELHRRAFNECFAEWDLGWHWGRADYARLLKTTGGKERIAAFMAEIGTEGVDIPALHAAKTARYTALMAQGAMHLRPGVAALIARARARGQRLAIATTTSRPNVEALSLACFARPASEVFDVIAAGDEVAMKKPCLRGQPQRSLVRTTGGASGDRDPLGLYRGRGFHRCDPHPARSHPLHGVAHAPRHRL
jgi:beta-phosphoglucomutase-like phosphatase (HAD superfamily)